MERALATLMSNLPGMAYRCRNEPEWTMEFVSDGVFALTGYPASDLVGNYHVSYAQLIDPRDRERVWEQVQEAVAAERPFQVSYRIQTASGEEKWVWEQGRARLRRAERRTGSGRFRHRYNRAEASRSRIGPRARRTSYPDGQHART